MGLISTKHVDIKSAVNACGTADKECRVMRKSKSDAFVDNNSDIRTVLLRNIMELI